MSDDTIDAHAAIVDAVTAEAQKVAETAAAVWAKPALPKLASAAPPAKPATSPKPAPKPRPAAKAKPAAKAEPAPKN
jgi:ribonuclease E